MSEEINVCGSIARDVIPTWLGSVSNYLAFWDTVEKFILQQYPTILSLFWLLLNLGTEVTCDTFLLTELWQKFQLHIGSNHLKWADSILVWRVNGACTLFTVNTHKHELTHMFLLGYCFFCMTIVAFVWVKAGSWPPSCLGRKSNCISWNSIRLIHFKHTSMKLVALIILFNSIWNGLLVGLICQRKVFLGQIGCGRFNTHPWVFP